ncbi:MAG TPA: glutaredoxin family protein [Candidatus Nanoarchaeia archaeon]|nr:glutaredoxin family protein [Candidatus Nanoarchaeia archaeon]
MSYQSHIETVKGKPTKNKIMLYGLSTCMWCEKAKELLDELGISYGHLTVDLLEGKDQDEAYEVVSKYNPDQSFPVIVIDDGKRVIIGYNEEELKKLAA